MTIITTTHYQQIEMEKVVLWSQLKIKCFEELRRHMSSKRLTKVRSFSGATVKECKVTSFHLPIKNLATLFYLVVRMIPQSITRV